MKKLLCALTAFVLIFVLCLACACNKEGDTPEETPVASPLLKTDGNKIKVAETGEEVLLQGVNLGGWLVREGWLCPMNLDKTTSDTYTDLAAMELLESRFGAQAQNLWKAYLDNWLTEADFDNIAALGMNCVRLNFAWYNLYSTDDYTLLDGAFDRLDWAYEQCAERGIYLILDLHGAIGSQNGQHHSGDITQSALFSTEDYMDKTVSLWETVAAHFADSPYIAGYDLLNEPEGGLREGTTKKPQWDFYDKLYKAIRAVDQNHIIVMEAVWEPTTLPNATSYGWENVVYELHCYDWGTTLGAEEFWANKEVFFDVIEAAEFAAVPWYVGEFNCFDSADEWAYYLSYFGENSLSWTIWSWKATSDGFSCWGLYSSGGERSRADLTNDTYDEILAKWSACTTGVNGTYIKNQTLYDNIKDYIGATGATADK